MSVGRNKCKCPKHFTLNSTGKLLNINIILIPKIFYLPFIFCCCFFFRLSKTLKSNQISLKNIESNKSFKPINTLPICKFANLNFTKNIHTSRSLFSTTPTKPCYKIALDRVKNWKTTITKQPQSRSAAAPRDGEVWRRLRHNGGRSGSNV